MKANPTPGVALRLDAPPSLIQALASAIADELGQRGGLQVPVSPYLGVDEAAAYIRGTKQRVYDLVSAGAITPARDGRRLLFRREALDAYLTSDGES